MTHVAHLTSSHPATDTRVFWKECRTLAAAGFEVTLVVPDDGGDREVDGVRIRPVRRPRCALERLLVTPWRVTRAARDLRADVLHFHDPELLPWLAAMARRRPVVYDSHEDLVRKVRSRPQVPPALRGAAARVAGWVERWAARRFAAVISAEPAGVARFDHRLVRTVANFPLESELESVMAVEAEGPPIVLYVGSISRQRGAVEMARLAAALPPDLEVDVVVAGPGPEDLLTQMRAVGGDRLVLPGPIDRAAVVAHLACAAVGLVLLHPVEQYEVATQPVKLFEYLGAGVPVVAADFPGFRSIVAENDCGILVDPLNADAVAGAVRYLLSHPEQAAAMGRRGRDAVLRRYTWRTQADELLGVYRTVLGHG